MTLLPDKIWFRKTRHAIEGRLEFPKEMSCIDTSKLSFDQELLIREKIKDRIMADIFGEMPNTSMAIIRHLSRLEKELIAKGDKASADKTAICIALVSSLYDQMIVNRPTRANLPDNYREFVES